MAFGVTAAHFGAGWYLAIYLVLFVGLIPLAVIDRYQHLLPIPRSLPRARDHDRPTSWPTPSITTIGGGSSSPACAARSGSAPTS